MLVNSISFFYSLFNDSLEEVEKVPPWKLAIYSATFAALATFSVMRMAYKVSWTAVGRKVVSMMPSIDKKLVEDMLKIERELEEKCYQNEHLGEVFLQIPEEGVNNQTIIKQFETNEVTLENDQINNQIDLILKVYQLVLNKALVNKRDRLLISNKEKEIVRMFCNLLNGDIYTCGNITYDATSSIRHAVFSARETAKIRGIQQDWEMIVPESAHPAFDKIANEYNITLIKIPLQENTHKKAFQADLEYIKNSISSKTIMIALSCPNYPYGIVDPITELSNLLETIDVNRRIGLHVDASLGGMVIPWMKGAGFKETFCEDFGFANPRVTSLSINTPPLGRMNKGCSVVLYRNEKWREHQIFVTTEWVGGIYCTQALDEREAALDIAGTWALMVSMGRKGFVQTTKKLLRTSRELIKRLRKSSDFEVLGDPKLMVIAFGLRDKTISLRDFKAEMKERGWSLRILGNSSGLQISVNQQDALNPIFVEKFMGDLKHTYKKVKDDAAKAEKAPACLLQQNSLDNLETRAFIPKV